MVAAGFAPAAGHRRTVRTGNGVKTMPMTTTVDLDSYADEDTGRLKIDELLERIDELLERRDEYEADGRDLEADLALELRLLRAFVADVNRGFDCCDDSLTFVAEDNFERFVRYEAEQEHGIGPDNVGDYVDWTRYAGDLRGDWAGVVLDNCTIRIRRDW